MHHRKTNVSVDRLSEKAAKVPIENGASTSNGFPHNCQKLSASKPAMKALSRTTNNRVSITAAISAGGALLYMANRKLSSLAFTRVVTLLPVAMSLYAGVRPGLKVERRIIPLALVVAVVGTQLPVYLACGIATGALMAFSLATMPSSMTATPTNVRGMPDFTSCLWAGLAMTIVLLTENFLIWVLSATFEPGQNPATTPPPLQDNGKSFINFFFSSLSRDEVIGLRRMWNTQWALVVCLGASFFTVEKFHPIRSIYSVGTRAFLTIAVARFMRTVSFMLTVVPSQIDGCYDLRFPNPPPSEWREWILVGFLPRTKGGCNDLIISGHSVIMSTLACVAISVANDRLFAVALWSMVFLDYTVVIYEGLHYSVDMFLGASLILLLWQVSGSLECPAEIPASPVGPQKHHQNSTRTTVRNAIIYAPPAVLAYLQLIVLPQWTANFVILLYTGTILTICFKFVLNEGDEFKKRPYMHYAQHATLCGIFLALGIYL